MVTKVSWLFNQTTGKGRTGGFSETWYTADSPDTAFSKARDIAKKRLAFLPGNAVCVGIRVQELGKRGYARPVGDPGAFGAQTQDIPQMATQCVVRAAVGTGYKRFQLRGVPDVIVVEGDYQPTIAYTSLCTQWAANLFAAGFCWRGQSQAEVKIQLLSIAGNGDFVLKAPLAFVVNDDLQILGGKNLAGIPISGTYTVEIATDATHGRFLQWNLGAVGQSGQVRKVNVDLVPPNANTFTIEKISTRKVGRPFGGYHGRAMKR